MMNVYKNLKEVKERKERIMNLDIKVGKLESLEGFSEGELELLKRCMTRAYGIAIDEEVRAEKCVEAFENSIDMNEEIANIIAEVTE